MARRIINLAAAAALALYALVPCGLAQTLTRPPKAGESRPRMVSQQRAAAAAVDARPLNDPEPGAASEEAAIQAQISSVYQNFYNSYRLGAGDVIAIHVERHKEDSVERAVVSPVGQVYYPLMGNVPVAGKTLAQLEDYFTSAISEYIKDPRVTLSLVEAHSSKIGVLGDVRSPGVMIMARPMRVMDAIAAAGGVTELGNASNVSILRQHAGGQVEMLKVDVKKILKGKADPEENARLLAGDTIIVHGNLFKKMGKVSSMLGIGSFLMFLGRGGR